MKRQLTMLLAAALATGGLTMGLRAEDKDDKAAGQADRDVTTSGSEAGKRAEAEAATFPAGIKLKKDATKDDHSSILKPIGTAVEASLTKDGFDDLVERLVDQDRNRIGKEGTTKQKFDDLNAKAQAISNAWKTKYGEKFNLDRDKAFTHVATLCGEIEDAKAVATAWPVPTVSPAAGEAVTAASKEAGATDANIDSNLEKGRDVAIATIPASHDLPALHLSLIQELGGWKLDIPNNISGQQLHDNLLKHLTHVEQSVNEWPVDKDAAALMVAHHVIMGVYGVDVPPADHQKKTGKAADRDRDKDRGDSGEKTRSEK